MVPLSLTVLLVHHNFVLLTIGMPLTSMGDRGFHFCLLHTVIAIWRGIFWLKWQGNKIGLNGRAKKLV